MNPIRISLAAVLVAALWSLNAFARQDDGATINTDILLIQFHEPPLARYTGGIDGLEGTARSVTGKRIDAGSDASLAYRDWLRSRQDEHLNSISRKVGRQVEPVFRYDVLANGVAIRAEPGDYARIKAMSEVKAVTFDRVYPLDTDRGPMWIGAPSIWNGTATGEETKGEGVTIGVIDTGINFGHPSFSDTPDDGHTYVNPNGSGNFLGWCDPSHPMHDPSYACNDKLIGAWDYSDALGPEDDGPVDDDGHGSHTASTAAGNDLTSPDISGVAPHGNVIMYDTCFEDPPGTPDGCPLSATSAAAQQALIDGVDAINYSIGGGSIPWSPFDIDSFFLELVNNGAFVAASAGNSGPGAGTVGHNGPWVATSGASTHDRAGINNSVTDFSGGDNPPVGPLPGQSRTSGYGPETVVYAGDFANGDPDPEQCLNPFPANTWTSGEIVLCDRGTIARVLKCANVAAGGAGGCILANVPGSGPPVADPHIIPASHVDLAEGDILRAWLASGSGHMARITAGMIDVDPSVADIMAEFSSRGPGPYNVLKPDLTNPGVNIFAAVQAGSIDPSFPGPDFGTLSGTSMSSPHTAGSGALLKALYPGWSPSEIKSALMTTAVTSVMKEDGTTPADPFDFGGGRVDLEAAAQAGLVLHETYENFLAANPDNFGRPETLNLASMAHARCAVACTFTRTVRNPRSFTSDWTFSQTVGSDVTMTASPSSFSLAPGATQEIEFTVTITGGSGWLFGEGTFTEQSAQAPPARFTAAVQEADLSLSIIRINTLERMDSVLIEGVTSTGASDLQLDVHGLVALPRTRDEVEQDPTNGSPYDSDDGTVTYWLNGLSGARRLHASTLNSEAPDLDLFVGRDTNMNGMAESGEQVCSSTSPSAEESCEVLDPADGDWWVRVQNWQGSGNPMDAFTVRMAAVPDADLGNASAVSSIPNPSAGQPFDVTFSWNFVAPEGNGEYIGVMTVGSSPGSPEDLGSVPIDYTNDRLADYDFEE